MKSIVLAVLLGVLTPALGWAEDPGSLNTITGVTVNGATVEITGTKKPNFTTFTMTEPPRLVIDISEANLSGVKDVIPVGNGTITAVQTANYGSEEAAIARVLIIYAREVETDIQARGSSLVVSLSGGAGAAVAARTPPAPSTPNPVPVEKTPEVVAITSPGNTNTGNTPEQATVAAREDTKRQEAQAEEARKAALAEQKRQEAQAEEARKAALAERQKQERDEAEAKAKAEAEAKAEAKKVALAEAEAQRQAQARAEAERKAQEQATRLAAQQAERQRQQQERETQLAQAAAEKQRQQEAARTAAEEKKRLALEEKQQKAAEEKTRREAAALAAAEARQRQQDEARAAAEEKKRLAAEERERQRAEAQAAAEPKSRPEERPARVARAEVPSPLPAPTQVEGLAVSARRKTMTLVGFKQESSGSRVFVRTNEPVRYTVSEVNKTVVLELENTRIGDEKNARMLDTSFFDTPVSLVDATYASPARTTVRVAIKLKRQVPYQTHQEGNVLSIEFERPTPR